MIFQYRLELVIDIEDINRFQSYTDKGFLLPIPKEIFFLLKLKFIGNGENVKNMLILI